MVNALIYVIVCVAFILPCCGTNDTCFANMDAYGTDSFYFSASRPPQNSLLKVLKNDTYHSLSNHEYRFDLLRREKRSRNTNYGPMSKTGSIVKVSD